MKPIEAALKGRRRDRLHHRLDQPLADRGVHPAAADGRHRRPAVPRVRGHRDHDHRRLRLVSLTLTPMMCSRFLRGAHGEHHGRCTRDRGDVRRAAEILRAQGLDVALKWHQHHLCVFLATLGTDRRAALHLHPQGLLPAAGHRHGRRYLRGGAGRLVHGDVASAAAMTDKIISEDPDGAVAVLQFVGAGTGGRPRITGASTSASSPGASERPSATARSGDRAASTRTWQAVSGMRLYLQPSQDVTVGGRLSRTQYQYTLQDADLRRAEHLGAEAACGDAEAAAAHRRSPPTS